MASMSKLPFIFLSTMDQYQDPIGVQTPFYLGIGLILSAVLLVLTLRSQGENQVARVSFSLCALIYTLGRCLAEIALTSGQLPSSPFTLLAVNLMYCALAAWPVSILSLWAHGDYSSKWRWRVGRVILALAVLSAVLLGSAHVAGLLPPVRYVQGIIAPGESLTTYNGLFFFWLGAAVFLPGRLRGRLSWISVAALLVGVLLLTLRAITKQFPDMPTWLRDFAVLAAPLSLFLVVAGGLLGFARFRFSDVFAQVGLRILLGALIGLASAFITYRLFGSPLEGQRLSAELALLGSAGVMWIGVVGYARISTLSDWLVDLQIFRQADYHRELKRFRETISTESDPLRIFELAIELARSTLRINDATIHSGPNVNGSAMLPASSLLRENRFAIPKGDDSEAFSLLITLARGRETLFNAEIDFLRELCLAISRRFDGIDREKENIEHARREGELERQLLEAQYQSLRAQVNPHFLFNSLNSIAALIRTQPKGAEQMTVRLAKIFRHVLTHHDRPFSTVGEEISFLEAYLEIEKVRFGERLQVTFDIQASLTHVAVPTLILQPLVENSVKHGLAQKIGQNQLNIRVREQMGRLELSVEDNGVGVDVGQRAANQLSTGVGLRNVQERLQTIYCGQAEFSFESEPQVGSRARIVIPIPSLNESTAILTD
jgi:two-component system, LytTR family, sensor kinase